MTAIESSPSPAGAGAEVPSGPVVTPEVFLGRVDTGAASTSVNAHSIRVEDDTVEYILVNGEGREVPMRSPLAKTDFVRTSEGREERVYVELAFRFDDREKRVLANLNDRSQLRYPLLLGRNWLEGDYLVDVEHPARPESATAEEPGDGHQLASRHSAPGGGS